MSRIRAGGESGGAEPDDVEEGAEDIGGVAAGLLAVEAVAVGPAGGVGRGQRVGGHDAP